MISLKDNVNSYFWVAQSYSDRKEKSQHGCVRWPLCEHSTSPFYDRMRIDQLNNIHKYFWVRTFMKNIAEGGTNIHRNKGSNNYIRGTNIHMNVQTIISGGY